MARTPAAPEGFWRWLGFALSPITLIVRSIVVAVTVLILLVWLITAFLFAPAKPAEPPAEARRFVTRLAAVTSLPESGSSETCKPPSKLAGYPAMDSCTFTFGKTSILISWIRKTGRVASVSLTSSSATLNGHLVNLRRWTGWTLRKSIHSFAPRRPTLQQSSLPPPSGSPSRPGNDGTERKRS